MPKLKFPIGAIKCAFKEWMHHLMPNQSVLAIDFGETEEAHEETMDYMWKRFVKILQSVEKSP